MPEYLSPGVYIEEVANGPVPIAGVSTSTGAVVGLAQRGPTNTPTLVTSAAEFRATFGGPIAATAAGPSSTITGGFNALAYAVDGFFLNGGKRLYVSRVMPQNTAAYAVTYPLTDSAAVLQLQALDTGAWANPVSGFVNGRFQQVSGLRITLAFERSTPYTVASGSTTTQINLTTTSGLYANAVVDIGGAFHAVQTVSDHAITPFVALGGAPAAGTTITLIEFGITADVLDAGRVVQTETFHKLNVAPGSAGYVVTVLGAIGGPTDDVRTPGLSALLRASLSAAPVFDGTHAPHPAFTMVPPITPPAPTVAHAGDDKLSSLSSLGLYKLISDPGNDSTDPNARQGIYAFRNIRGMLMIGMPGITDQQSQSRLLALCENDKYKFAILDPAATTTPHDWHTVGASPSDVQAQRGNFDSEYGALYYPWIQIDDPAPPNPLIQDTVNIPPSGHVMGIYARSDIERGVHKAPANEVVNGALSFSHAVDTGTQDILNPLGINCLRDFRAENRGLRVWGARTMSSNADWKYVSIRRLFQYVEASIEYGTQWVVFEPNNELLWARVRQSVSDFLLDTWRTGALMGTKPSEAFYVLCDRRTMTQSDIENGKLICEIGIAPTFPAEFVIFRISKWTATAQGS